MHTGHGGSLSASEPNSSTGSIGNIQRWQRDWNRDHCATVAQLRTGHSPLLAGSLHRIGRRDSATCPHYNGADETAEHLVLRCPAHDQARRDIWLGGLFNTDPRRLWEFLERIGAMTAPPTGNERERALVIWLLLATVTQVTLKNCQYKCCRCISVN